MSLSNIHQSRLNPVLVFVLASRSGAIHRLENTGIRPYPDIEESVGFGNGRGDQPIWVFKVHAGSGEIREFYSTAESAGEWSFQDDNGIYLLLRKDGQVMKIAHHRGWSSDSLIYMIEHE